jgi:hypothetical protein
MTTNDPELEHAAHVSITIPFLEKLFNHEQIEYAAYWIAGSLVIDMPDIRNTNKFTVFGVRDIENLEPGDDWRQQYLISLMYIRAKNTRCSFYSQAQSNIRIFENT